MLRRRDVAWLSNVLPKLDKWGYKLPMRNAEVRKILASPEDRKELLRTIKTALR